MGSSARTCVVWTARVTYRGADRVDVTRAGRDALGGAFAPSWALLGPYLAKRRRGGAGADDWSAYVAAYTAEMRTSWRARRAAWVAVLGRPAATLVCYCADPTRCHRTVLAGLLAAVGPRVGVGVVRRGERAVGDQLTDAARAASDETTNGGVR